MSRTAIQLAGNTSSIFQAWSNLKRQAGGHNGLSVFRPTILRNCFPEHARKALSCNATCLNLQRTANSGRGAGQK